MIRFEPSKACGDPGVEKGVGAGASVGHSEDDSGRPGETCCWWLGKERGLVLGVEKSNNKIVN